MVEFAQLNETYRVPIRPVLVHLGSGHSSLSQKIIKDVGVRLVSDRGILLDFLAGID